jgi:NAD(P)-dependent dehydrogenase (short-subunit alcohol dehydrogenase family)
MVDILGGIQVLASMSRSASSDFLGINLAFQSGGGPRSAANLRVLITGAGRGIGYACARAFAERGADLILSDIDGPALKRAASDFHALGRFCDVASEASVAVFIAEVLKSYASLDVLINAAGRSYVRNLGTLRITRALLPMMKSDGGEKHIVNIASMGAAAPSGCHFPYAASQEAFDRLSDALAENVRGTKIALTTVVPHVDRGDTRDRSPVSRAVNVEAFERYDPEQVAAAVVQAVSSNRAISGRTNMLGPRLAQSTDQPPAEFRHGRLRKQGH